mmetsp:Transcript_15723/g.20928  ORF Transcript_15723/g.20928 Transcript_15723/m.20928 type:complete len:226 (-) Transcript_15723:203-880(-)
MGSVGADDVSGAVSETAFGDTRDNQEQHKESTADPQASSPSPNQEEPEAANGASPPPSVKKEVSSSKPALPPFVDDPNKITLKFIFANRDGLHVIVDCKPGDSVGEVKGALLSMWPKELPNCSGGDKIRLICMGKGLLMPDSKSLEDCQVPVFKTHATPVNVSVRPEGANGAGSTNTSKKMSLLSGITGSSNTASSPSGGGGNGRGGSTGNNSNSVESGCFCIIS